MKTRYVVLTGTCALAAALVIAASDDARAQAPEQGQVQGQQQPRDGDPIAADEMFRILDANGDGVIDAPEWAEKKMLVFYFADDDRSLGLDRSELPDLVDQVFAAADTDGDGTISGYEFNQADFTQFPAADMDGDDVVREDELDAFLGVLRGR